MHPLLLLVLVFAVLELWLLVKIAAAIGALTTFALVIGTGLLGVGVLKRVGWRTALQLDSRMRTGQAPGRALVDGFLAGLGGLLLMLPGLIGDVIGLLCLLKSWRIWSAQPAPRDPATSARDAESGSVTIEGEYRRED